MTTSNKYHPRGRLYTYQELVNRRLSRNPTYLWASDKPFNKGIKKANRLAESQGLYFTKLSYYA